MEHPTKPYSAEDVAVLLDVSLKMVWRLCRDGELPAVKAGRKWYIRRPEFDAKFGISGPAERQQGRRARKSTLSALPIW